MSTSPFPAVDHVYIVNFGSWVFHLHLRSTYYVEVAQGSTNVAFLCFSVFLMVCRLSISGLFSSHLRIFTDGDLPYAGYTRSRLIETAGGLLLHEKEPDVVVAFLRRWSHPDLLAG